MGSRNQRRGAVLVLAVLALVLGALPAQGAERSEILDALDARRAYAEGGASLSSAEVQGIAEAFAQQGALYGVVVLADNPAEGTTILADDLAGLTSAVDVVTVISPNGIGVGSTTYDNAAVQRALDAADDAFASADDARALVDVGNALYGTSVTVAAAGAAAEPIEDATSSGFPWVLVGVLLFFVGGFLFLVRRSKRKAEDAQAARLAAARAEVREDLEAMADHILELDAQVTISDDTLLRRRYDEAAEIYRRALAEVDQTDDLVELAELDEEVELARWHLESVDAILDGRPEPDMPAPDPPAAPPPPPPAARPSPTQAPPAPRQRRTQQYPDWAREEARRRQARRRPSWGGISGGDVLGGVLGGVLAGGGRRRRSRGGGFGGGFGGGLGGPMFPGRSGGGSRGSTRRSSGGSRSSGGRRRTTGRGGRSR